MSRLLQEQFLRDLAQMVLIVLNLGIWFTLIAQVIGIGVSAWIR